MNELAKKYQEQKRIFLQNDRHSSEIIRLFNAMELAFKNLKPYTSEYIEKRMDTALIDLQRDLSNHLNDHIEAVVKEVNNAKDN